MAKGWVAHGGEADVRKGVSDSRSESREPHGWRKGGKEGLDMLRKSLTGSRLVTVLLCLQVVPLVMLPAESWSLKTQEWWLPVLLTVLVIVALVQLLVRRTRSPAPWVILSFTQGFSIISRLMMLLPHTMVEESNRWRFDWLYVVMAVASIGLSWFWIWYCDLPEVRRRVSA
jgi:hypothetical protein